MKKQAINKEAITAFQQMWSSTQMTDLSLHEFVLSNNDGWCAHVEKALQAQGIANGGSPLKFGINNYQKKYKLQKGQLKDITYYWAAKYGETSEQAFQTIKERLQQIQQAALDKDLSSLENIEFSPSIKWKVAYLYAPESILPIFSRKALEKAAFKTGLYPNKQYSIAHLQSHLISKKPTTLEMNVYAQKLQAQGQKKKKNTKPQKAKIQAAAVNHWIFSSNQKHYDINQLLGSEFIQHNAVNWAVSQRGEKVRRGDMVYLYRSGEESGIVAKFKVVNEIADAIPSTAFEESLWRDSQVQENYKGSYLRLQLEKHLEDDFCPLSDLRKSLDFKPMRHTNKLATETLVDYLENHYFEEGKPIFTLEKAAQHVFLEPAKLQELKQLLAYKKNIVLQGPPGVGKSFLSDRLAYLILGSKRPDRVRKVQFHQSYSYEDFVEGYRPTENGHFTLQQGIFYQCCQEAKRLPHLPFILIIDEINRGNLSKIFGELLLLIEADKRNQPIRLTYSPNSSFVVPPNLYLIGTMNTADRSLAMVDYALRRRFGFVDIVPHFGKHFATYLQEKGKVPASLIKDIQTTMTQLNDEIANHTNQLGTSFCIGHSYFCNFEGLEKGKEKEWYQRILRYEIIPLLREYWFDDLDRVKELEEQLMK